MGKSEKGSVKEEPNILLIGCGGAGCNTVSKASERQLANINSLTINTNAQELYNSIADEKLLIGREITNGFGTGSNPDTGRIAAVESKEKIKETLSDTDAVILTCGLGRGTGSGASPVIADIAGKRGAFTVGVVTLPFKAEGENRRRNAEKGLNDLLKNSNLVIVVPYDRISDLAPNISITSTFEFSDDILLTIIEIMTHLIRENYTIDKSLKKLKSVLGKKEKGYLGIGKSKEPDRGSEATKDAFKNPLLDIDTSQSKMAFAHISCGSEMNRDEVKNIIKMISDRMDTGARVLWTTETLKKLEETLRVVVLILCAR